jgi:hypothetical protein
MLRSALTLPLPDLPGATKSSACRRKDGIATSQVMIALWHPRQVVASVGRWQMLQFILSLSCSRSCRIGLSINLALLLGLLLASNSYGKINA